MKKVLIVLLSVLLLVSFVSCEKDKSEEIIKNLEDFYTAKNICENAAKILTESAYTGESLAKDKIEHDGLMDCLNALDLDPEVTEITNATGSATFTDGVKTYNDIVVTYTKSDGSDYDLSFSGKFDGSTTDKYSYELKVAGTDYSVSWTYDNSTGKYATASVNGNDVEVRLLNSTVSVGR